MSPPPRYRLVLIAAAIALARVAPAQPDAIPTADTAREREQYAIAPSAETLLSDMLGLGQSMPGGCAFTDGQIERTSVLATYTCGTERIVLRFLHPELAPPGSVRTKAFAIAVSSGTPPEGLIEAIADRVRAREATFEWTSVGRRDTPGSRWTRTAGAVTAIVALSAAWLLAARKRRHGRGKAPADQRSTAL